VIHGPADHNEGWKMSGCCGSVDGRVAREAVLLWRVLSPRTSVARML
jgi:hypothetical protein